MEHMWMIHPKAKALGFLTTKRVILLMEKVFEVLDRIIYWLVGIGAAFGALLLYIYKSKVHDLKTDITTEKTEREKADDLLRDAIETETSKREIDMSDIIKLIKDTNRETITIFKEGLIEERQFRTDVMVKQGDLIEKLFEKVEESNVKQSTILSTLTSSITHQEKMCNERHKNYKE